MRIICAVGARPNFVKMAPVIDALARAGRKPFIVHTGQHYDHAMSHALFEELGIPSPDVDLGVGSDSHARQTARVMERFEALCEAERPDLVVVAGDVNSTLAVALTASKLPAPVAHVEAGLRSFDRTMPEEINRVLVDHLADLLFTTEAAAGTNLAREGIPSARVHFVGNCMVDTLFRFLDRARAAAPWRGFELTPRRYALLTLHRPATVDDPDTLGDLLATIAAVSRTLPVVFPAHPRTARRLGECGLVVGGGVRLAGPMSYLPFLGLMAEAALVLTDSGGIQEETTALGVPCLTLRPSTERPVTVEIGTNRLVGTDRAAILGAVDEVLAGRWRRGELPPRWDGGAADRIAAVIDARSWGRR